MELYLREFFLSRILSGYEIVNIRGHDYKVVSPNIDILYKSNIIYKECLQDSIEEGLYTDKDICNLLIDVGMWTEDLEYMLNETLPQLVVDFQLEMFRSAYKEKECEEHRDKLIKTRQKMSHLYSIRHQFDHYTDHGIAKDMKYHYIIENTTFNSKNKLCRWDKFPVALVVEKCNENRIELEQIRELSHTNPWLHQWHSIKDFGNIFNKPIIDLSYYQQWLFTFSKMYDNIHQSMDCPDDFIIDDDDLLDGWIINQKEIKEKERAEKQGTTIAQKKKFEKADEIFVVINAEDYIDENKRKNAIDRINRMNSAGSNIIKKSRLKQVAERGNMEWKDFSDVKQLAFQAAATQQGKR